MTDYKLAVLIDADNVPYSMVTEMFEEISKNGTPTIKRIYADWTTPTVVGWKKSTPRKCHHAYTTIQLHFRQKLQRQRLDHRCHGYSIFRQSHRLLHRIQRQ